MNEEDLIPGTEEYRRARRRRQNRESASRVRALNKEKLEDIQEKFLNISETNQMMEKEIMRLRAENKVLRTEVTVTEKATYAYLKAAVIVLVLAFFPVQIMFPQSSGILWTVLISGLLVILLAK